MPDKPTPADTISIRRLLIPRGDTIPNNDCFPAVIAKNALGGAHDDAAVRRLMEENGWGGTCTWRVFDYHHFHPDCFEALAVARGLARLMLGGPQGEEVEVSAGDVAILPPGFGHCQVSASDDFAICGAYPPGQEDYSIIRAEDGYDDGVLRQIAGVSFPGSDPVWGGQGPFLAALRGRG